jgi:thymidylate synthase (FAD)
VKKNSAILKEFIEKIEKTKQFRKILLEKNGIKTQPYLLLNADRVKVINSTNARMDKEIMNERLCNNAQWEIRKLYEKKLEQLRKIDPTIYGKIGPGCTRGACPEGSLSCGKMREMQEKYAKQKTS